MKWDLKPPNPRPAPSTAVGRSPCLWPWPWGKLECPSTLELGPLSCPLALLCSPPRFPLILSVSQLNSGFPSSVCGRTTPKPLPIRPLAWQSPTARASGDREPG